MVALRAMQMRSLPQPPWHPPQIQDDSSSEKLSQVPLGKYYGALF